jgi:hypothetical protein
MAGRKPKSGKRTKSGQLSRSKASLLERNPPTDYIRLRRDMFAFITPSKGPDGRVGEIDQDICDGIGQIHALGLLDGHGIDGKELRDAGRFFGEMWWNRYRETAPKSGKYERADKSISGFLGETAAERRFARMDETVKGYDRAALMSLVVDKSWGDEIVFWAKALIDEALLQRGKVPSFMRFPDMQDRALLAACIRGLCVIVDGGMEMRRAA